MSHPKRLDPPADAPPWRDHIYFSYWDPKAGVYGVLHWNNSPNSPTGKTQVTAIVNGRSFEVVEGIEAKAARYTSDTTEFDMRGDLAIHHPRLTGRLELTPRFQPCDYTARGSVPPLVPEEPLHHFQQGFGVTGHLVLDGDRTDIDGLGFRARSWGYRDESLQFPEYFSLQTCMDGFDFTVLKFPEAATRTVRTGDRCGWTAPSAWWRCRTASRPDRPTRHAPGAAPARDQPAARARNSRGLTPCTRLNAVLSANGLA